MKMKKLVSAIAALAMSVSAFAGMAVTANAEDEISTVIDKNYSTMTANEGAAEVGNFSIVNPNNDGGGKSVSFVEGEGIKYQHSTRNNPSYAKTTFSAEGEVTLNATWNTGSSNSAYGNAVYISFNDADGNSIFLVRSQYNDKSIYLSIGDGAVTKIIDNVREEATTADDLNITAKYDTVNKVLRELSIVAPKGSYTLPGEVPMNAGTITEARIGVFMDGTDPKGRKDMNSTLKKLSVSTVANVEKEAVVTINKVDEDNELISTETISAGEPGTSYTVPDSYKTVDSVEADGVKYVYTYTDEGSTTTISSLSATDSENVITLVFTKAAKASVDSVTVNYVYDNNIVYSESKAVSGFVDDSVVVGFKKYVLVDGTVYEAPNTGSNGYYRNNFTLKGDDTNVMQVAVSVKAVNGTVVSLVEGYGATSDFADIRTSEGEATRGTVTLGEVEEGVYSIEAISYQRNGDTWVYLDGEALCRLTLHSGSFGVETTNVTVPKAGVLTVGPGTSGSDYIDCLLLTKTGELTTDAYVFEGIVIEDFANTNLCFEVSTADAAEPEVKFASLSSFVDTAVSGEGAVNLGIVIVNDVADATVNKVWLDVDADGAYTE